jgi:hypothetical protein
MSKDDQAELIKMTKLGHFIAKHYFIFIAGTRHLRGEEGGEQAGEEDDRVEGEDEEDGNWRTRTSTRSGRG